MISTIHILSKFFIFLVWVQKKDYSVNLMPSYEYTDSMVSIWKTIVHVFSNNIIEIAFSSGCRGMCYRGPKLLASEIHFYCSHFKVWKQDVAYHWYERLIRCLFLFPQMLLAHFRIVEIYYVKDVTHLLLPHGLSKNVMTMTIRMFHKAVLTSCCLPGTCWLSSVHIHLQNASAESSIFNF